MLSTQVFCLALCLSSCLAVEMTAFDKSVYDLLRGKSPINIGKKLGPKFTIFSPSIGNMKLGNIPAFEMGKPIASPAFRVQISDSPENIQGLSNVNMKTLSPQTFRTQIQQFPPNNIPNFLNSVPNFVNSNSINPNDSPQNNINFLNTIASNDPINIQNVSPQKIQNPFEITGLGPFSVPKHQTSTFSLPSGNSPSRGNSQSSIFTIAEEEIRPQVHQNIPKAQSFQTIQRSSICHENQPSLAPFSDQLIQQSLPRDLSVAAMSAMNVKPPFDINQMIREQLQNNNRKIQQQKQQEQQIEEQTDNDIGRQQQQESASGSSFNFNSEPINIKKSFLEPYLSTKSDQIGSLSFPPPTLRTLFQQ